MSPLLALAGWTMAGVTLGLTVVLVAAVLFVLFLLRRQVVCIRSLDCRVSAIYETVTALDRRLESSDAHCPVGYASAV